MDILVFQSELDALTSWRKRELIQAHFLAENAQNDEARQYLCRAWVLMMYAHCDNFLKEATKLYLKFSQTAEHSSCKAELIWLTMRAKEIVTDASTENYKSLRAFSAADGWSLIDDGLMREIFNKHSFKFKFLRFICDWVLQVDYGYIVFRDFCDHLKKKRNSIAHGEGSYVDDISDCLHWHEMTITFIDTLKDAIINSAIDTR